MRKEYNPPKVFWVLLVVLIGIILASCSVERQAQRKTAWLIAHDKLDDVCARIYPPKDSLVVRDSVSFDTLYVENEVIYYDTVYRDGQMVVISKPCPPHQVITQTIRKDSLIYRTNTAEVDRMKGEVLEVQRQLKDKDSIIIKQQQNLDKDNWWKVACIITWALVGMGGILWVVLKLKK